MAIPTNLAIGSTSNCYEYAAPVTLDDAGVIPMTRGLWINHNNAGNVKVRMLNGDDVTFAWHGATSFLLPVRCSRVWLTGTTTSLVVVALY
jgi:hypothetical protein